jgi:hypothetical protein
MGVAEALACPEFVRANTEYERIIQDNVNRIKQAVAGRTGCSAIQTVPLPTLYRPTSAKAVYGGPGDDCDAINPGPVNGLVLNRTMVVPRQSNPAFATMVQSRLQALGVNPRFIDDRIYHFAQGEVHCSSNALRTCTP